MIFFFKYFLCWVIRRLPTLLIVVAKTKWSLKCSFGLILFFFKKKKKKKLGLGLSI